MIKKKNQPGCPCCSGGGPCTWVITIRDCRNTAAPRSGVSVTITQGATSYTGTTNGSGVVTFAGIATGSWTATATAPTSRYSNTSAALTLSAGTTNTGIVLTVASGYHCLPGDTGAASECHEPIPNTIHISSTTVGSGTMTYSGTEWHGTGIMNAFTFYGSNLLQYNDGISNYFLTRDTFACNADYTSTNTGAAGIVTITE